MAHDYEQLRTEWCRIVRPGVLQQLERNHTPERTMMLFELGRARCTDADLARLQQLARYTGTSDAYGARSGLILATDTPARAQATLVPLFQGSCDTQRGMFIGLERELDPAIAAVIARTAYPCYQSYFECAGRDEPGCVAHLVELLTRH